MDSRESGLWVPASEHQSGALYNQQAGDEDEDEDEDDQVPAGPTTQSAAANGEQRGREEERPAAA